MSVQLVSEISNLCDHKSPTSQTDGQTDRRTTCDPKTAQMHLSVLRGKNDPMRCVHTDCTGKSDGELNETTATTTTDENATAAAGARDDVNAAITTDDVQPAAYGRHCALVGTGWLFWYPAARPAFGFLAYYVVPMLLIGVLYGRVVCRLLTTAPQCHTGGDRDQLRRKQAARSYT